MFEKMPHIKDEVYIGFMDRTIDVHWNYHAILMVSIWLVLVPLCITIIRFGKPRPTEFGLRRQVHVKHIEWWWFSIHKYGLSLAVFLTVCGVAVALAASRGFSGSVHAILGSLTVILAVIQIAAGLLRGTHGGKYYFKADPDDYLDCGELVLVSSQGEAKTVPAATRSRCSRLSPSRSR